MSAAAAWWAAPVGGEAPDYPPDQLGPTQARRLRNFLVHNPGRIVPRGGIGGPGATESGALPDAATDGACLAGTLPFQDTIFVSYRAPSATPLVDPWRVPINRPATAPELAQPDVVGAASIATVKLTDGSTGTGTGAPAIDGVLGNRYCNIDEFLYTPTLGGTSTTISTGVAQLNRVLKISTVNNTTLTTGPGFVQDVISHAGRLWALAARDPGDTNYDTSGLYYTIPNGTTALLDQLSDWQDPVTGELNKFSIGAANDGDFGVALGRAAGQLVIFKRRSIWVLYGTAPSNFTLRQIRTQSGCVDARSVVVADEGVYFASQRGYERFDGTQFELLSRPIADTWLALSNVGVNAGTVNHSYIRSDALPNDYLHVSLGTDPHAAAGTDGTERAWLLHRPTGAWIDTQFAPTNMGLGAGGYGNRVVSTVNSVTVWAGGAAAKWARADALAFGADETIGVRDRYSSSSFDMDLIWRTSCDNMGSYRHLDGRWYTNTLENATVDYHQHFVDPPPDELTAFATVRAEDGFGAAVVPELDVPGYQSPGPVRVRQMFDTNQESNRGDISVTFQSTTGSDAALRTAKLAVHGMGVTFQHGRERHVA